MEAGFEKIGVYITRRNNTYTKYIATRPILDLCERSVWRSGEWVSMRWWDQEGLDLAGAKERAVAELDGDEAQCEEGTSQEETKGRE